ncbi:MAG TPA: hypothetical protein VK449_02805, partial [Anaerolineales bacterium]|nr:hypothetical protein [Anaerolineales bacterium]
RRLQGVFEFTDDPDCVLRLRWTRLAHPLLLSSGSFPAGTDVLEIHLWNEHVPPLPPAGADVPWAAQATHRLRRSLAQAAAYVRAQGRGDPAALVAGATILADGTTAGLLLRRLGFELCPRPPSRSMIEHGQNRYALGLMASFNAPSVRNRTGAALRRTDLWMPMRVFLDRYAPASGGEDPR